MTKICLEIVHLEGYDRHERNRPGRQEITRMLEDGGTMTAKTSGGGWGLRQALLLLVIVAFVGLSCDGPASELPIGSVQAASREHAIERKPVRSSALRSVGYDPGQRVLEVEFTGGEVYRYFDVPAKVHRELMAAESHGRYFQQHVRNKGYRFQKVN